MTDCLQTGEPSQYIPKHQAQLSLPFLCGSKIPVCYREPNKNVPRWGFFLEKINQILSSIITAATITTTTTTTTDLLS